MYTGMIITAVICGYVLFPLFVPKYKGKISLPESKTGDETLFIREILRDLEFDRETGKLDEEEYQKLVAEQNAVLDRLAKQRTGRQENKIPSNCAKCGAKLKESDNFCSKCGTAVHK